MDASAVSFNTNATEEDGSCIYFYNGENYGGGLVFYVDASKKHGLICASTDQSSSAPFGGESATNATATELGSGQANTTSIVNSLGAGNYYAAGMCDALVLNGYSDWYLPSLQELLTLNTNMKMKGLGGFSTCDYWSSTESNSSEAWVVYFGDTSDYGALPKSDFCKVRAIRSF